MASKYNENQPIGIFDSGIGGLTVMRELMHRLPHEHMIYFGDTARLPYGEKSKETITRYSIENAIFLLEHNIKLLVIACNTASAFALEKLQTIFSIPVLGVIEAGAENAIRATKNKHIAVLGTKGTIQSGVYQSQIVSRMPQATVVSIPCPLFVPLVEERFFHHPAASLIIKEYLIPLQTQPVDTILLGCTHYPLLKEQIAEQLGKGIAIVDSATSCAEKVEEMLHKHQLARTTKSKADYKYYVSDDPKKFQSLGAQFLGTSLEQVFKHGIAVF
jgi:glutamate racemase